MARDRRSLNPAPAPAVTSPDRSTAGLAAFNRTIQDTGVVARDVKPLVEMLTRAVRELGGAAKDASNLSRGGGQGAGGPGAQGGAFGSQQSGTPGPKTPGTETTPGKGGGDKKAVEAKAQTQTPFESNANLGLKVVAAQQALALLESTLSGVGKAAAMVTNESLSAQQKLEGLAESLPIIGGLAKASREFAEGITGVTEALRQTEEKFNKARAAISAEGQRDVTIRRLEAEQFGAQAKAESLGPVTGRMTPDRPATTTGRPFVEFGFQPQQLQGPMTAQQDIAFGQAERRAPLEMAKRSAEAEAEAARAKDAQARETAAKLKEAADAAARDRMGAEVKYQVEKKRLPEGAAAIPGASRQSVTEKLQDRAGTLIGSALLGPAGFFAGREVDRLRRDPNKVDPRGAGAAAIGLGLGPGAGIAADRFRGSAEAGEAKIGLRGAANEKSEAIQKEIEALKQLQQAQELSKQTGMSAAQAESAVRKANIALIKDEITTLKEKAAQVQGMAQTFGGLTAPERAEAGALAKRFQQRLDEVGGAKAFEELTPEAAALIAKTPAAAQINKAREASALADPTFKGIADKAGIDTDLEKIQKQIIQTTIKVQAEVQIDEAKLAQEMADRIAEPIKALKEVAEKLAESIKRQVQAEIDRAASLQQAGG